MISRPRKAKGNILLKEFLVGSIVIYGVRSGKNNCTVTLSPGQEHKVEGLASHRASQILWVTVTLSEPIPNGFYSIVAERRLKELFDSIPSLDELHALYSEGLGADVIVVDNKDKKLSMLKQLTVTLVKGLNSNPAAVIKKDSWIGLE
ncbi:hypothetical protein LOK49_Contig331G00001 [Camellia lanceoleosa]|nr:hypothetical protein LOK49_Contig331G00001 [Camellia lanceoleosa]